MYNRILAPLDSSELSELSLEHVRKVALAGDKTEVVLLIVLEHISYLAYTSRATLRDESILNIEKESQSHARDYIDRVVDGFK